MGSCTGLINRNKVEEWVKMKYHRIKLSTEVCEVKTGSIGTKYNSLFSPQFCLNVRVTWITLGNLDIQHPPWTNQVTISGDRTQAVQGTQSEY